MPGIRLGSAVQHYDYKIYGVVFDQNTNQEEKVGNYAL